MCYNNQRKMCRIYASEKGHFLWLLLIAIILGNFEVCKQTPFFLTPMTCFLFISRSYKGNKTSILLDANLILGVYDYSVVWNVFLKQ